MKELEVVDLVGDGSEIVGGKVEFESGGEADVGVRTEVVGISDAVKRAEGRATQFAELKATLMALTFIHTAALKGLTSDQWYPAP